MMPPFLFCSAISISMTSFSGVSLIAMVPDSECRMPTLIGPVSGAAGAAFACGHEAGGGPQPGRGGDDAGPEEAELTTIDAEAFGWHANLPLICGPSGLARSGEQDRGQARR